MLFEEIKEATEDFVKPILPLLRHSSKLYKFTKEISEVWDPILDKIMEDSSSESHHFIPIMKAIDTIIKTSDIGTIFLQLHDIKESAISSPPDKQLITEMTSWNLHNESEILWKTLNATLTKERKSDDIKQLIRSCKTINRTLNELNLTIEFLNKTEALLIPQEKLNKQEASLTLGFSSEINTLTELNLHLNSLQTIYTEACLLLGVNEGKYPLRILKVESGSLSERIFGESKVIEFISWFLKNSIRYLHRRFTLEGKLYKIPIQVKTLDDQLKLYAKLKTLLPEDQFKKLRDKQANTLSKTAVLIAKNTQKLIERETKLKVNDEVIQLQTNDTKKYLKAAQKQLPEHIVTTVTEKDTPSRKTGKKKKAKVKVKKKAPAKGNRPDKTIEPDAD